MAFAPLIIRWGPDASSDLLRQSARCSRCGPAGVGWLYEVKFDGYRMQVRKAGATAAQRNQQEPQQENY
jgi:hypothetical protein